MASGNFYGGVHSNHYRLYVYWSSTPNVAGLYSTVTVTTKFWCDWSINFSAAKPWDITCNGVKRSGSYTSGAKGTGTWTITTQTFTVNHSNGVAKSINISANFGMQATISGTYHSNISASGTANLGTITQVMPTSPTSVTTNASTVAQTNTAFTISWSGATKGTFAISKYRIYYHAGNGWVKYKDVSSSSTSGSSSCTLSGITSTRGTKVRFAVRTFDSNGNLSDGATETSVTLAKLPAAPTTINVSDGTVAHTTTSFTLSWSGATAGSGSISKYRITYTIDGGASFPTLKEVTGTSTSITLNGIVDIRGKGAQFFVHAVNSYGLSSPNGGPGKMVYLANIPTAPTNLTIANYTPKRNDSIAISWSGATAGSGSISNYWVDVRRYVNGYWTDWKNISAPTSTNYTWSIISTYADLKPNDIVQVRVGLVNSYYLNSSHIYSSNITIKGGIAYVNVNGVWKEGIVYVNVNGTWKEATSVYTKINDVWKESI